MKGDSMWNKLLKVLGIVTIISVYLMTTVAAETTYDYTLLIYMNGSDLESEYQSATDDLLEMIEGDIPTNVAVIIETGGTATWHTGTVGLPQISHVTNQRWKVTQDGLEFLEEVPMRNMGASETLESFLDYGLSNFSSDQYGLIMWNHGAGAIYGYGADENYDYDTLSLEELQTAMEASYASNGVIYDFVGFDACLMASVETAHVLAPYALYMVGSEELEPGHGWYYAPLMDYLASVSDPVPVEVGREIINGFEADSVYYGTSDAITASLVDLSKIDQVRVALDQLLLKVRTDLADPTMSDNLLKARLEAESFGEGNDASDIPDSDMVDIIDYAIGINDFYPHQAEEVVLAVQEAVLLNINSDLTANAYGLSFYLPARDKETMTTASQYIRAIGFSEIHATLIEDINDIMNRNNAAIEYESVVVEGDEAFNNLQNNSIEGNDQFFYFQVQASDLSAISQIAVIMGQVDNYNDIQYLASDRVSDEEILDDGVIIGETLEHWVEINGVTVAMYYENQSDSGVKNYYVPIKLNDEDADLIVLFSTSYPSGKILGARKLNNDNENVYNRSLIALEPDDRIDFIYEYDIYSILDDNYAYDGWYIVDSIEVGEGLNLSWAPLDVGEYTYAFEITDIYGNIYQTDWITYELTLEDLVSDSIDDPSITYEGTDYQGGGSVGYLWLTEGSDLPSEWAIPYVSTAYNNGLTTEKTLQNFTNNITREEFCELVVNQYEKTIGKSIAITSPVVFTDTTTIAVAKAYEIGVVSGYGDGSFGPDDEITREQLITMFYRLLTKLNGKYSNENHLSLTFEDSHLVSDWAIKAAESMVAYELINGVGDNRLAPQEQATIEQSLKLVNGVYEFYIWDNR